MKPFEGSARALGWVRDDEMYPDQEWSKGVVHPQGWWAPGWQDALSLSPEERKARWENEYAQA